MLKTLSALLCGAMVLAASVAQAGESVLLDEANPPFMYADGGKPAGLYNALISEAFKRAGIAAEIAAVPWRRALAELDAGRNAVGGIYMNANRLKKYDYSDKLSDEVIVLYVPAAKAGSFKGIDSLKGMTIGVIRGWSYGDDFDNAVKTGAIKTEAITDEAQSMAKLAMGRLDGVVAVKQSGDSIITRQSLEGKVAAVAPPLSVNAAFVAFNKTAGKLDVVQKFNAALAAMHQDGTYDRLASSSIR
jgi:polar amino acid transport system substrate-binding protein